MLVPMEGAMVFGWRLPGYRTERSVEAISLEDARAKIRSALGVSRLPPATRVWDAAERPIVRWVPEPVWVA